MLNPRELGLLALSCTCVRAGELTAQGARERCVVGAESETVARVTADVRYLADDARDGRAAGTQGYDAAVAYVLSQLAQTHAEPVGTQGFLQRFDFAVEGLAPGRTANVLARVRGEAPDGVTLLVGAHLDHVGHGARGSRSRSRAVHNGADDNASGSAAVLELARSLSRAPARRDVVLAWFGGEEIGLLGSRHLATHPVEATRGLGAVVNFDMVGRLRDCRVIVEGRESARGIAGVIAAANARSRFDVRPWDARLGSWGSSDHHTFAALGVPYLFFFTGLHREYHTELDDAETLNFRGIAAVIGLAERALRALAALPSEELRRDAGATRSRSTAGLRRTRR